MDSSRGFSRQMLHYMAAKHVSMGQYKEAEKDLKDFVDMVKDFMESHNSKAEFAREEK